MKTNTEHEKIIFNYFLHKSHYLKNIGQDFFKNKDLNHVSKLAKEFYLKFAEPPTREQMKALVSDDSDETPTDIIDTIYNINLKEYDKEWLKRTAEAWVKWRHFNKQLIKTVEYIKTQKISPDNVENVVQQGISMISTEGSINFDVDVGLNFFDPEDHKQLQTEKIETGWTFVDRVSGGGYNTKSLVIYAGEQGIGKCLIKDTFIKVRNKKTGKIQSIKIGDFYNKIRKSN